MADRYFRVDVSFFHKNTCRVLLEKLGVGGPLAYLSLCARAKDSTIPGTFIYSSDAVAWEKLGLDPIDVGFTLDEFFTVTGRIKQTSRTRVGRQIHVKLTQYERWQKDSKRYESAVRKSRSRREKTRDNDVTGAGHTSDSRRDLDLDLDLPPNPPLNGSETDQPERDPQAAERLQQMAAKIGIDVAA